MPKNRNIGAFAPMQGWRHYQTRYREDMHRLAGWAQAASPGLFLRELMSRPESVGAVLPSSRQLAWRIAAQVPLTGEGLVVELGAGTGSVTQALLDHGIPADRLWVVEQSPAFVQHLRHRFPALTVIGADAARLEALLPANRRVDAVVSSLPLRSLPACEVAAVLDQCRRCLPAGGRLVQFTYALWGHGGESFSGFAEEPGRYAWWNMPPARIRTFTRIGPAAG
ncbi:MAG TPA: methyltransferase domain-containing protein [Castellaniella sp.]|nr:methyltransferase domain-containing protein [Castellaniella sp.]